MPQSDVPKYPFKKVGELEDLGQVQVRSLARSSSKSGAGKAKRQIPKKFLEQEKAQAASEEKAPKVGMPKWFRARVEQKASRKVVLDDAVKRLQRAPSAKALRTTQMVLNELGRRRGGGKALRETITQDLVDELVGKGE